MVPGEERNEEELIGLMYIRCAWCGHWTDVVPGPMNKISHSICPACSLKIEEGELSARPPAASGPGAGPSTA